jgi:intein/homing endonuclease
MIKINNEEKSVTMKNYLKIDIENSNNEQGAQVVIYPSICENYQRKFLNENEIISIPKKFKEYLQSKIGTIATPTNSEIVRQEIQNDTYKLPLIEEGEGRHQFLFRYACILRKQMSVAEVESAIVSLNKIVNNPPLEYKEIRNILSSTNSYDLFDEKDLANKVIEYLKEVKEADHRDIERIIYGDNRLKKEEKSKIDKVMAYLRKENLIIKKRKSYIIKEDMEWKDTLLDIGIPIDFKMPYFHDVAHFNKGDLIILGSKNKYGKCISNGLLLTNQGFVDIAKLGKFHKDGVSNINKHWRIFSGKLTGKKVYRHPNYFYKEKVNHTIKIKTNCGYELEGTPEHPIKIVDINKKSYFKKLEEINTEDKAILVLANCFPKESIRKDRVFFKYPPLKMGMKYKRILIPKELTPELARLFGYIIGDGSLQNNAITIYQDKKYIHILEDIRKVVNSLGLTVTEKIIDNQIKFQINSSVLAKLVRLKLWGIKNRKKNILSSNRKIPQCILSANQEIQTNFIGALLSCESSLSENGILEITMASKDIIDTLQLMSLNFGIICRKTLKIVKTYSNNKYWRLIYPKNMTFKLLQLTKPTKYIGINITEGINKNKLKFLGNNKFNNCGYFLDKIVSIEHIYEEKYVYDFNMENKKYRTNHQFWCNGFINHNTHLSVNFLKRLVDQGIKPYYIYNESGGRFGKIALHMGMKEGDFFRVNCADPEKVLLRPNAVTIYDWVRPPQDEYAKTASIFNYFVEQLEKTKGNMICFVQLKEGEGFFAPNLIGQFPALLAKYLYSSEDGIHTYFDICDLRDPIKKGKHFKIPCTYNWDSKEVFRTDEIKEGSILKDEQIIADEKEE